MAHGFLQSFDRNLEVLSAGTEPAKQINQKAVHVMREKGIEISHHTPNLVDKYINDEWAYVIIVSDDANETCPVSLGKVKHRFHIGFEDHYHAIGTDEFIVREFRRVRDEIKEGFYKFYIENIKNK
jgi:arsenate reductase